MLSKSVKISVLSLFAVAFAAEAFAQATINSMDQNADQSQGCLLYTSDAADD